MDVHATSAITPDHEITLAQVFLLNSDQQLVVSL